MSARLLAATVGAFAVGAGLAASARVAGGAGTRVVSGDSPFADCATAPAFTNAEVEPALAADPRRPKRLVAVYQQDRYHRGGSRGIVVASSADGGSSWRRAPLPVSRCAGAGGSAAHFASDPWVSIGPDGRVYVSALSDVVSVLTSHDGGASWSRPAVLRGGGLTDKPTVTADPRRPGTAYVVWSDYRTTKPPGLESNELLSITHDGGSTWTRPKPILRHARRAGPADTQILVDSRSGRLYALTAWVRGGFVTPARPAWMLVQRSSDGGAHWSKEKRFALGHPARRTGGPIIRSSPQVPSFAIDAGGVLYAAWQDARFSGGAREAIVLTRSSDGGRRWSPVRKVSVGTRAIIPTLAARGRGGVGLLYLELGAGGRLDGRYRLAVSTDGGRHFRDEQISPTFSLSSAPRLTPSPIVPGGYFVGDYMGIAPIAAGRFGAVFVSASGESGDPTNVFYATGR